jgi:hypothetical protein
VGGDEGVVDEPWVGGLDAGDFFGLAGGEGFAGIEAAGGGDETLLVQDVEDAGDAAVEVVSDVEDGTVGVGEFGISREPRGIDLWLMLGGLEIAEEGGDAFGPDAPLSEESAGHALGMGPWGEEVADDVIVISGVEGDVAASAIGDGADGVGGLVAIEGSELDGDESIDFIAQGSPKVVAEEASADGGLEVEADDGENGGDVTDVSDEGGLGGGLPAAGADEDGFEAEGAGALGFGDGLGCGATNAGDADLGRSEFAEGLGGEREDGLEEEVLRVADGELRRMQGDGQAAGSGRVVVADESPLMALRPASIGVEGEGKGRNDMAGEKAGAEFRRHGLRWARRGRNPPPRC